MASLPEHPLERLAHALMTVFGTDFEDEIRAKTEREEWYKDTLPGEELFQLWARRKLLAGDDPGWVFTGLRMSDRTRLFDVLQLDVTGMGSADHAFHVLDACGIPARTSQVGPDAVGQWNEIARLTEEAEDERAAALARQRAERLLRKLLYFYCTTGHASVFVELIADPGSLRVPKAFKSVDSANISACFLDDDVADLGFLALAFRKFSARLEHKGVRGQDGGPIVLFSAPEHQIVTTLATSLQPYTHDKPSKLAVRRNDLANAARAMAGCVAAMVNRNTIPVEVLVLENCSSIVGGLFRGLTSDGKEVHLATQTTPPLGKRVLVLSSAFCKYATCIWAPSPW